MEECNEVRKAREASEEARENFAYALVKINQAHKVFAEAARIVAETDVELYEARKECEA